MSDSILKAFWLLCLGLSACRSREETTQIEAAPQNRYIIGAPAPWPAAALNAETLDSQVSARRAAAWSVVARAIQPVVIHDPVTKAVLLDESTHAPLSVPVWQTWYDGDEFKRIFREYYWSFLTPAQRAGGTADEAAIDGVMAAFPATPLELRWRSKAAPTDTGTRFERLLPQLAHETDIRAVNGVSGAGFTLFSPDLIRHYLKHFAAVSRCAGSPADQVTGEPRDLATCFDEPFPAGAVAVKATWTNVDNGVAVFDTTAKGLATMLATDSGSWLPASDRALEKPGPGAIYTASTFSGVEKKASFRLTGLHIITKELPRWLWVSLWWSPTPGTDFGEDRPESVSLVAGTRTPSVWANYKMCTVSNFDEADQGVAAEAAGLTTEGLLKSEDKSLRAALLAGYHFTKPHSFCSNPYIEIRGGDGRSNCIGCHQFSGPFAAKTHQQAELAQQRQNFMSDFLWSFEDFTEQFRGTIIEVMQSEPDAAPAR